MCDICFFVIDAILVETVLYKSLFTNNYINHVQGYTVPRYVYTLQ